MSRLAELAQGGPKAAPRPRAPEEEACDLCGEPVPPEHRHLVDLENRRILCGCRACSLLFDREGTATGGARFRLIPERVVGLEGFDVENAAWESLRVPVDLAFFFKSSAAGRTVALYPGPMGATESLLELETWEDIEGRSPALGTMEADVEALLVNRARGERDYFVVPIDVCYRLVAVIRMRWHGLGGGEEVWKEIEGFFGELREEAEWQT